MLTQSKQRTCCTFGAMMLKQSASLRARECRDECKTAAVPPWTSETAGALLSPLRRPLLRIETLLH